MPDINLSFACGAYDRTLPLADGRAKADGIGLTYVKLPPAEIFWRQLQHEEFDVSEMSLSAYIQEVARGESRFVGIPVFPSRVFRRAYVFVRADSGIEQPSDLKGRRVGVPEYHMTAALFIRGFLSDDYGVRAQDVQWVQGGQHTAGRKERVELDLPPEIKLERVYDRTIDEMLLAGDIDAVTTAYEPRPFREGDPRVRRLFEDPVALDIEAFHRTGIFPIMHLVTIRRKIYERNQWIARELEKAFVAARDIAYKDLSDNGTSLSMLPFFQSELQRTKRELGEDFWPYGIERNRATLEAAARYSHEQGLSPRLVDVDELFPASVRHAHGDDD